MKILTGLTLFYVVFYVRTLWSHRTEESDNAHRENELAYVDTVTETNSKIIPNTTIETNTTETEISKSLKKNDSVDTSTTESGITFEYTFFNESEYSIESRIFYRQMSNIKEKLNNYNCPKKNGRFPLSESCDEYIECKNGSAVSLECLDGLHFDAKSANTTPCKYSIDVSCTENISDRYNVRECPKKFGYFKIEDKYNCSSFRICEFGNAYDFECPNGLAFSPDNLRCDWPHKVPECDAEAHAGFRCPDKTESYQIFRSSTDCQVYYTCVYGVPRRQSCGKYMGYDERSHICAPADRVEGCDPGLVLLAKKDRSLKFIENKYSSDYDDGDGYFIDRFGDLSFSRRVRMPKVISFPFHH